MPAASTSSSGLDDPSSDSSAGMPRVSSRVQRARAALADSSDSDEPPVHRQLNMTEEMVSCHATPAVTPEPRQEPVEATTPQTPPPDDGDSVRQQIYEIYRQHDPSRSSKSIDIILGKYKGSEETLLEMLRARYTPSSPPPQARPPEAPSSAVPHPRSPETPPQPEPASPVEAAVKVWAVAEGQPAVPLLLPPDSCVSDLLQEAAAAFPAAIGSLPPGELQASLGEGRLSNRTEVSTLTTSRDRAVLVTRRPVPQGAALPPPPQQRRVVTYAPEPQVAEATVLTHLEEPPRQRGPWMSPTGPEASQASATQRQARLLDSIRAPSTIASCTQFDSDEVEHTDWVPVVGAGVIVQKFDVAPPLNGKKGRVTDVRDGEAVVSLPTLGKISFAFRNLRADPSADPPARTAAPRRRRSASDRASAPRRTRRSGTPEADKGDDEPLSGWGQRNDASTDRSPRGRADSVRTRTPQRFLSQPRFSSPSTRGSPRLPQRRSASLPRPSGSWGRQKTPLKVRPGFVPRCAETPPQRPDSPPPSTDWSTSYPKEFKFSPAAQCVLKPLPTATLSGKERDPAEDTLCEDCGRPLGSSRFCRRNPERPHELRLLEIRQEQERKKALKLTKAGQEALGNRLAGSAEVSSPAAASPPRKKREKKRRRRRKEEQPVSPKPDAAPTSPLSLSPQTNPSPALRHDDMTPPCAVPNGSSVRHAGPPALSVSGTIHDPCFCTDLNGTYAAADTGCLKYVREGGGAVLYFRDGRWHLNDSDAQDEWLYSSDGLLGSWVEQEGSMDYSGVRGTPYPCVAVLEPMSTPAHNPDTSPQPPTVAQATPENSLVVAPGCAVLQVVRRRRLRDAVRSAFGSVGAARVELCSRGGTCAAAALRQTVAARCGAAAARAVPLPPSHGPTQQPLLRCTDAHLADVFRRADALRAGRVRMHDLLAELLGDPRTMHPDGAEPPAEAQRAALERVADSLTVCGERYVTFEEFAACTHSAIAGEGASHVVDLDVLAQWHAALSAADMNSADSTPQLTAAAAAAAAEFDLAGGGVLSADRCLGAVQRLSARTSERVGARFRGLWRKEPAAAVVTKHDFCALFAAASAAGPELLAGGDEAGAEAEASPEPEPAPARLDSPPPPKDPSAPCSPVEPLPPATPGPPPDPPSPPPPAPQPPPAPPQPEPQPEQPQTLPTDLTEQLRMELRAMVDVQNREREEEDERRRQRERELEQQLREERERAAAESRRRLEEAEALAQRVAEQARAREHSLQVQLLEAGEGSGRRGVEDAERQASQAIASRAELSRGGVRRDELRRLSAVIATAASAVGAAAAAATAGSRRQADPAPAQPSSPKKDAAPALRDKGAEQPDKRRSGCCVVS
eukprot:TRINITY_DN1710_c7_g1_i1.p1 TRINITY_DN1710_c7_g1~~TRINITY_DN1710_c7_g1_i1.p1  ORF type:complete len:1384 (+),score=536.29 TRINITY_DN1710_c7_g1_i1:66-4154(+)